MVMSAYIKSVLRTFKGNISRFISITLIVMLGSVFVSGLGTLNHVVEESISEEYLEYNGADIILKNKTQQGFSETEINEILGLESIEGILEAIIIDLEQTRVVITDMSNQKYNKLEIVDGDYITQNNHILSDRLIPEIGNEVNIFNNTFTVVGTVMNPTIYSKSPEINYNGEEILHYYYLDSNYFEMSQMLPVTDLYITLNLNDISIFSKEYKEKVDSIKEILESNYNVAAITYKESVSHNIVSNYSEKIYILVIVFPAFFLAVASLVVLSTMSRLIEEERGQMGCFSSLGFSKLAIVSKYLIFSFVCCITGSVIGIFIGVYGVPSLIYSVFNTTYFMPVMTSSRIYIFGIAGAIITLLVVLAVSLYVGLKELSEKPCDLLRPKAPRVGKKILLERIPLIWNKLKFKYKSSFRNVFRYKKNLIMTIVSVSGSTGLIIASCALYNLATVENSKIPETMASSFASISLAIILFAGGLSILVLYNLTNMNIGERKREIASLKVLGYQTGEVCLYIYREILIMTILGIIVGIPVGLSLIYFLINYLDFGTYDQISILVYIISCILVIVFVLLVDLLLINRIKNVDMNDSLKTNE